MAQRIEQYLREIVYCFRTCADLASALRLAVYSVWFHCRNGFGPAITNAQAARTITVRLRLMGKDYPVTLRPFGGDVAVLYQVIMDEYYALDTARLERPRTIADLGANIGLSSLYLAVRHEPELLVCVEAAADSCRLLRRNMAALGDRCRVVHAAVSAEGKGTVFISSEGPGWSRTIMGDGRRTRPVTAISVDDVLSCFPGRRADLMKINIEGAEEALIHDQPGWLDRVGCLLIEVHDTYGYEQFAEDMGRHDWHTYRPGLGLGSNTTLAVPAGRKAA